MTSAERASSRGRSSASRAFSCSGVEAVEGLARLAQRGVVQLALLAAGAADEHRPHALGVVSGERGGALGRLVVRVGVHGQHAQREPLRISGSHVVTLSGRPREPSMGQRCARLGADRDQSRAGRGDG